MVTVAAADCAVGRRRVVAYARCGVMTSRRACCWWRTKPGLRLTLSDRLASEGYVVHTATDGESGLGRGRRAGSST